MSTVLFTSAGTSDPIRGEHDGPVLHILRHYRPDAVFILLTPEIYELGKKDNRLEKIKTHMADSWGYSPEITVYGLDNMDDPSSLDELDESVTRAFKECVAKWSDSKILINISSGTPQIKTLLFNIAVDVRFRAEAIQVKNYEKAAGSSERTNGGAYDIDCEIEFNEDELDNAVNRCVETKLVAVKRQHVINQIKALLEKREFTSLSELREFIPENLLPLIDHLSERSKLNRKKAAELAKNITLDFELYPKTKNELVKTNLQRDAYQEISEYALIVKNLQRTGKLSEFILRMEPLVCYLQRVLVDEYLFSNYRFALGDVLSRDGRYFLPDRLDAISPMLYQRLGVELGSDLKMCNVNTYLLNGFLAMDRHIPENASKLFSLYEGPLKEVRNAAAHDLSVTTEAGIKAMSGVGSDELMSLIEKAIQEIFPQCNPAVFNVYDRCIRYIIQKL